MYLKLKPLKEVEKYQTFIRPVKEMHMYFGKVIKFDGFKRIDGLNEVCIIKHYEQDFHWLFDLNWIENLPDCFLNVHKL